jgi:hypothetical protein
MVKLDIILIGGNDDTIHLDGSQGIYLNSGFRGTGIAPTSVRLQNSAGDGGVWRSTRRTQREFDLPLTVLGASREAVEGTLRRLSAALSDRSKAPRLRALYSDGTGPFDIEIHYTGGAETTFGEEAGETFCRWPITVTAPDPYWTSVDSESVFLGTNPDARGLLPKLAALQVKSSQVIGDFAVENSGDVDAYPTWTFRGPADAVTVADPSGKSFSYDAAIAVDETITVDTKIGTVTNQAGVNKYGSLGASPKLFSIPAGRSVVNVSATGTSPGTYTPVQTLATNLVTNPSMEAASGTVTVRTNLVTNPSMEAVSTGSTTLRTNLCTNPNFETNGTGTGQATGTGGSVTVTRVSTEAYVGGWSMESIAVGANYGMYLLSSASPSTTYMFSAWVKGEAGKQLEFAVTQRTGANAFISTTTLQVITATGSWQRVSGLLTTTATTGIVWHVVKNAQAGAHTFYMDALMLEQTDQLRDYFDGATPDALGWDYGWSGTANASTSTAKASAVTLRTNLVTNPSLNTNVTGWDLLAGITGSTLTSVSISDLTGFSKAGQLYLPATSGSGGRASGIVSGLTVGTAYTASVWVKRPDEPFLVQLATSTNGGAGSFELSPSGTNGSWTRYSVSFTAAQTSYYFEFRKVGAVVTSANLFFTGVLLETGSALGNYFDGSTGTLGDVYSHAWTGTAHASTSVQQGVATPAWATYGSAPLPTIYRANSESYSGSSSLAVISTSQTISGVSITASGTTSGVTYSASAWVKLPAGVPFIARLSDTTVGGNLNSYTGTGSWQRVSVSRAATTTSMQIQLYTNATAATFYVDAVQLEVGSVASDYFDGASAAAGDFTYAWSGTAHASTSLRRGTAVTTYGNNQAVPVSSEAWSSTGTKSLRIIPTSFTNGSDARAGSASTFGFNTQAGKTYTVKAKCRLEAPLTGIQDSRGRRIRIYYSTDGSTFAANQIVESPQAPNEAGVTELSVTQTIPSNATGVLIMLGNGASAGNGDVWWDDLIVVEGDYTGDYFDGSTETLRENGYAWTGTPNASTSTWTRRELTGSTLITCNYKPRREVIH